MTGSTAKHISDGRAYAIFGMTFARGSRDFLGIKSPYVTASLSQVDAKTWKRVASC